MKFPINFKEFTAKPVSAIAFIGLIAVSYLYMDIKTTLTEQIETLQTRVTHLEKQNEQLQNKLIEVTLSINTVKHE